MKAMVQLPGSQTGLAWFELEIAPHEYRFAIVPGQPILCGGVEPPGRESIGAMLVRHEHTPEEYERTVRELEFCLGSSGVLGLEQTDSDSAFDVAHLSVESVHLRLAFADGRRWASCYALDAVPVEVSSLIDDTRSTALAIFAHSAGHAVDGDTALKWVGPSPESSERTQVQRSSQYANCLLTSMSHGIAQAIEIVGDRPVPDLESLAAPDPELAIWVAEHGFRYEPPDPRYVVLTLARTAGLTGVTWKKRTGEIKAIHALPGGGSKACVFDAQLDRKSKSIRIVRVPEDDLRIAALQRQADARASREQVLPADAPTRRKL